MDKVAIIIPAYNVQQYISKGIESCIAQTYENIEIIIIDDGSKDDTAKVVEEYMLKDSRIIFEKKENGGVSSARNRGLALCDAEYLIFLDSDDWLEKNAVEILLKKKNENEDFLVAVDRYWVTFGTDEKIIPFTNSNNRIVSSEEALKNVGTGKFNLQSACYKLYDKRVIINNSLRFKEYIHFGEDGLFVFEYLKCVKGISYYPLPLWNILDRPNSATHSAFNEKMFTSITGVEEMIKIETSETIQRALKLYLVQRTETVLASIISSGNIEDVKEYYKSAKNVMIANNKSIIRGNYPIIEKITSLRYTYLSFGINKIINEITGKTKQKIKKIILKHRGRKWKKLG